MKMSKGEFLKWTKENDGHSLTPVSQNPHLVFETNQGISLRDIDGKEYIDPPSQQVFRMLSYKYDTKITAAAARHTEKLSHFITLKGFKPSKGLMKKIQDSVLKKDLLITLINEIIFSACNRVSFSPPLTSDESEIDRIEDILMNEFWETGCLYVHFKFQQLPTYNYN